MSEEQDYTQQTDEFYLEARYDPTDKEIVLVANERALRSLRDLISWLAESGTSTDHVHLDQASGILEGDVLSLIIQRK